MTTPSIPAAQAVRSSARIAATWMVIVVAAIAVGAFLWRRESGRAAWEARLEAARAIMLPGLVIADGYGQICRGHLYDGGMGRFEYPGFYRDMSQTGPWRFMQARADREAALAVLREELPRLVADALEPGADSETERKTDRVENLLAFAADLNAVELLEWMLEWEAAALPLDPVAHIDASKLAELLETETSFVGQTPIEPRRVYRYEMVGMLDGKYHRIRLHAALVSAIVNILRQEGLKEILESDWEEKYQLARRFEDVDRLRPPGSQGGAYEPTDPEYWGWHGAPLANRMYDITSDTRERIVGWATGYLRDTPADRRRGAAGIEKEPVSR